MSNFNGQYKTLQLPDPGMQPKLIFSENSKQQNLENTKDYKIQNIFS